MKNDDGRVLFRIVSAMVVARHIAVVGGVLFFIILIARVLCFLFTGQ